MAQERFPFEQSHWAPKEPEQQRRWHDALETTAPENVRAILAQLPFGMGSAASIPLGTTHITVGFAQEWLAWHDRQKAEREALFRRKQIFGTWWTALAASIAAAAAAIGVWRNW